MVIILLPYFPKNITHQTAVSLSDIVVVKAEGQPLVTYSN